MAQGFNALWINPEGRIRLVRLTLRSCYRNVAGIICTLDFHTLALKKAVESRLM